MASNGMNNGENNGEEISNGMAIMACHGIESIMASIMI
jgi:hypothetical protein